MESREKGRPWWAQLTLDTTKGFHLIFSLLLGGTILSLEMPHRSKAPSTFNFAWTVEAFPLIPFHPWLCLAPASWPSSCSVWINHLPL